MSRHVFVAGNRVELDDKLLLGEGGEARVFAHPSLADVALKIFHDGADAKLVALRAKKLRAFPRDLPSIVVAPQDVVVDGGGDVVGYVMRRIKDAVDIALLARKGRAMTAQDVVTIFRILATAVDELHAKNVVVGDLNDGNVLVANGKPAIIDADSMQVGALPCPVAHERFLDPRLYGKSFLDAACFDAGSDAYALRVLLFQSLLGVHPYGGVHAKLPTLLRRAQAAWSVLRGDVQLPKVSIPFSILGDDMLDDFARCFDKGERAPLSSSSALDRVKFRKCTSCGVEHARASCPLCKTAVVVPSVQVRTRGGVREEVVVELREAGCVLQVRAVRGLDGNDIAYVVDDGAGRVVREDRSEVFAGARVPGMRFEIAGDATWIALGGELVKVKNGAVVDRARTESSSFAAGRAGLFVVEGDALMHHETRTRIGRVFAGQTLLVACDDGGFGFYRAGRALMAFGFTRDRFYDVALPPFSQNGKLVDVDVACGDDGAGGRLALVGVAEDVAGKRVHTLALVDNAGHLVAHVRGAPEDEPILQSIRGKCVAAGRVVSASDDGLCSVAVDGNTLRTGNVFADTRVCGGRAFVDASVDIHPGVAGTIVVVARTAITRLRLKP